MVKFNAGEINEDDDDGGDVNGSERMKRMMSTH